MKLKLLVLVIFCTISVTALVSMPVTAEQAVVAADTWWAANNIDHQRLMMSELHSFNREGYPLLWLVMAEGGGFILVSGDDAARPIIGYDLKSSFEYPIQSPEVSAWIDNCLDALWEIRAKQLDNTDSKALWDDLIAGRLPDRDPSRAVAPLISSNWNQGSPYNALCPANASGPGGHVLVGCGAVAMAQLMRYWSHPVQGTGSNSYNCGSYGVLSANFGQTNYNWDNMPNSCSENNSDIPLLLYHCGISVNMSYGPSTSSSYPTAIASALSQYFGYNQCSYLNKSNYSTSTWNTMLRNSLETGRPIIYGGQGSSGGHGFNLDGYQNEDYFHFNWGWSGTYNGYFYLSNLNPGGISFSDSQGAIIELHPLQILSPPQTANLVKLGYQVNVSWNPPAATGCTGYKVFKNGSLAATVNGVANTSYSTEILTYGDYQFQVSAVYPVGQSVQVNAGTAQIAPPSDPLVWEESFDQPQGWIAGQWWTLSNGTYSLYAYPSPSNYDTSLDSPLITLPANARSLITSMYIRDVTPNTGEVCEISVLVNNQPTVLWTHNDNTDWGLFYGTPLELPIGQFVGQSVKFRFRSYGGMLSNLGYWHIYDVAVTSVQALDVSGGMIDTGSFATVGTSSQISVNIINRGINLASNVHVNLYQGNGGLLGSNLISSIAAGESAQTQFPFIPTQSGTMTLYALISLAGDMYAENNFTEIAELLVYPQGYFFRSIGTPAVKSGAPVYANGFTGIHQTLLLQSELSCQGIITDLTLRSHFGVSRTDKPLKIWICNTASSSLSSLQSVAQSTLIFDGVLDIPAREQLIHIPFEQPFAYNGQNIIITYYSPQIQLYSGDADFWAYSGDSTRNRGIYTTNNTQTYDPLSPPSGYSSSYIPCIILTINGVACVNVNGRVVGNNSLNTGVASATVTLTGSQPLQTMTNSTGGFSFNNLISNSNYGYTVTAPGYLPLSGSFPTGSDNSDIGNLVMTEIFVPPQTVTVTVSDNNSYSIVGWNWDLARSLGRQSANPDRSQARQSAPDSLLSRAVSGFVVYRLMPSQIEQQSTWTMLSSVSAQQRSYMDQSWGSLAAGQYLYAVTTQYNYNQESAAAFSPITERYTDGRIIGRVSGIDGLPIMGANLLINQTGTYGPYSAVSDSIGYFCISGVHYGYYNLICSHPSYHSAAANISVSANLDTEQMFSLQDIPLAPVNLLAIINDANFTVELSWELSEPERTRTFSSLSTASRALSGFSVWRTNSFEMYNPALWTPLGESSSFCWTDTTWYNLPNNDYNYIVKAIYGNGMISTACISNNLTHLYYARLEGMVVNNDGLDVAGALVSLDSQFDSYESLSDSLGNFCIESIRPRDYVLNCSMAGYNSISIQNLSLIMHQTGHCDIVLQELLLPPISVLAQIIAGGAESDDWVELSWELSEPEQTISFSSLSTASRALTGFSVWRAKSFEINNPSLWTLLGESSTLCWTDTTWYNLPNNEYSYIVKAMYSNGMISTACSSNNLTHLYYAQIEGTVVNNDSLALAGALVSLSTQFDSYEAVSDSLGYFCIESILPGNYMLTCSMAGYDPALIQNLSLIMHQTGHCDIVLQELLLPPVSLLAQLISGGPESADWVELNWHCAAWAGNRSLVGFRLWRLLQDQTELPDLWVPLHQNLIADTLFTDQSWPPVQAGSYLYAVKACFSQDMVSEAIFSNIIEYDPVAVCDPVVPHARLELSVYPNPFNPSLTVAFSMTETSKIKLEIFNLRGQRVKMLQNAVMPEGTYHIGWDGRDETGMQLGSGMYLLKLSTSRATLVRKLMLLK